jgi:sucrose-6-phosphate hydrolase SacC (GH32 family)
MTGLCKTLPIILLVAVAVAQSRAAEPCGEIAGKTLVAWASPANLEQQGAGVVSMMRGEQFDAIVLGEIQQGRWMPGSDYFRRTARNQTGWPAETSEPGQQLQIAIVYSGNQITIYRNGQRYAEYTAGGRQAFLRRGDVLIGARYRAMAGSETGFFSGDIDEVRIYDRALGSDVIQTLIPGKLSDPTPLGMWTFENGSLDDRMGNYPRGYLQNGASVVDGRLRLDGRGQYLLVTDEPPILAERVQAGFFTPRRIGQMWDTWVYFHEGKYYQYYLAGPGGRWDGHELAVSEDGVHWTEHGVVIKPREGVTWMGTGHIWKAPDFDRSHRWMMNYSEWSGPKQDIMFASSTDLLNWTKVDERHRFVQDTRWYKPQGRWDCIDTLQRADGGLYGYFTADPVRDKVSYPCCGFGMAESRDGVTWTALPPPEGDISGEFGGIQKLGQRYYILISEGRVAVGDQPTGPFYSQQKNPNVFGQGCDIYFPRFFHNAPGGPLVNHFYNNGPVFSAPLKAVELDADGILRLKWWHQNDRLKAKRVNTTLAAVGRGKAPAIRMFDQRFPRNKVHVIEGEFGPLDAVPGDTFQRGVFLDHGDGCGDFLAMNDNRTFYGQMRADGSDFQLRQTIRREVDFGPAFSFRLLIKYDMAELYVNEYLMNLKRVKWNGHVGIISRDNDLPNKVKVWQSE